MNNNLILSLNKVSEEYRKMSSVVQDASQFTQELSAEWKSLKSRFHPVVWFFYRLINW